MAQDVIAQLREFRDKLREQLMNTPEYRALTTLEKTIEELSALGDILPKAEVVEAPAPAVEQPLEAGLSMHRGADQVAEALADALQRRPQPRPTDHLPSHRVA